MSTKAKGVIEVVLEKKKKDGATPYWVIIIEGNEYYDSKGNFKDKKGQEVEYEFSPSDDGKINFINPVGGGYKGGGSRGKSPEELSLQKSSFAMAYAKDMVTSIIAAHSHLLKELPPGMKQLEFLDFLTDAATKMILRAADEFKTKL